MYSLSSIKVLGQRLLIIVLLFTICRILFVAFNFEYFEYVDPWSFLYGIRFDLSIIAWLNMPLIIIHTFPFIFQYEKTIESINKYLFHIINGLCLVISCSDIIYFPFTLKRTTSDVFSFISFGNDLVRLLPQFVVDFWYIPLIITILIVLSFFLYNKTLNKYTHQKFNYWIQMAIFGAILGITIIFARGGLQLRPLQIGDAGRYTAPHNIPIILNTPFSLFTTLVENKMDIPHYYSDEQKVIQHYSPLHTFDQTRTFQKKNVVILIMESFGHEYLQEGYLPFLDSLKNHSLYCENAYANGKRSIDAVPSIVCGLPNLMNNPYIYSPFANNKINTLPNILKKEGYYSAFYHGGNNGTMGFDNFSKMAGFDNYFGKNEYPKQEDYDGKWGIFDEPYLQYFAKKMSQHKEPFLTTVFTLSSHHPYTVPEEYKGKFPKGNKSIHESLGYADYALKRFFETAQKQDWYKNTVFVITADHTSKSKRKYYRNQTGMFRIPILFYDPSNENLKGSLQKIAQQTDIFATILEYLDYPQKIVSFGNNLFTQDSTYNLTFQYKIFQYIDKDYIFHFDGKRSIGLYEKRDSTLKNNIIEEQKDVADQLEEKVKYHLQSYYNHLIQNKYFVKEE